MNGNEKKKVLRDELAKLGVVAMATLSLVDTEALALENDIELAAVYAPKEDVVIEDKVIDDTVVEATVTEDVVVDEVVVEAVVEAASGAVEGIDRNSFV